MITTTDGFSHSRFFIPDSYVLEEVQKTQALQLLTLQTDPEDPQQRDVFFFFNL